MVQGAFIFALGILVGLIAGYMLRPVKLGTLRIDRSNLGKDIYRIELDDFDEIEKHKQIILNIDANANFTHE